MTVTSHKAKGGGFIWYLGGAVAERGAKLKKEAALVLAREELQKIFPEINWGNREWATWRGLRAELGDKGGERFPGPVIREHNRILMAWPTKLTFAPALSDKVFEWLNKKDIHPVTKTKPPRLPAAEIGPYPWETATWQRRP